MTEHCLPRRQFLGQAGLAAGAAMAGATAARAGQGRHPGRAAQAGPAPAKGGPHLHISTNQYPWSKFYEREGRDFRQSLDTGLGEVAASGLDGFEPSIASAADVERLVPLLRKHGLQMRSIYMASTLHEPAKAETSIQTILEAAERARRSGTKIVVTNVSPLRWGGPENKDDAQLKYQAGALERLGRELYARGMTLAYHSHDIEMRNAAREFHHMLAGTDPRYITLCLDAHWVYRGSGNSTLALFDVLKLYGPRVSELHLRQSKNTIWTETFGEGDIDYPAMADYLAAIGVKPLLVLEQAPEKGTPKTMDAVEAHRRGVEYVRKVFAAFA